MPMTQTQRGFTMLEVLISILVFSLGLLGLANLQLTSLQFNHSAHMRSQAVALAYDMTDRLRANRGPARSGGYDGVTLQARECNVAFVPNPAEAVALQDAAAWRNDLACLLPNGRGRVERDGALYRITVEWDDARNGADGAPERIAFTVETEL